MLNSYNNHFSRLAGGFLLLLCLCVCAPNALAQRKKKSKELSAVRLEYVLTVDKFLELKEQTGTVVTTKGITYADVPIEEVKLDRSKKFAARIDVRQADSKRARRIPIKSLARLTIAETVYEPEYVKESRQYLLVDIQQRDAAAKQRLQQSRNRFWKESTPEEMQKFVEEEREFLKTVHQQFSRLNMQLYETEYFLFLTDIPSNQVKPYLVQLDQMNEALGKSFGFEEGHNVWRGKAVIVAFMQEAAFHVFERQTLENEDVAGAQGICHSYPNGRVVVGCFRGDSPSFFGVVLVHETAHGYIHRYRSTARIPSWINEGIADWVAGITVRSSNTVRERQQSAAGRIRLTRTLGGFFDLEHIEAWQYGLASSMIGLLATYDNDQFRRFFNDIKNGYVWQESLMRHYEMTPAQLADAYGREIKIPGLRP
jgi:hypothetical protein